ncbi:MAG: hypothetical protein J6M53_00105 [Bacteroidaceae bacterium]|nr:hypothetical protein [Bacteroidaceae bacterium]
MMKRLTFLCLALLATAVRAQDVTIATVGDLQTLATAVAEGNTYEGVTVRLAADLDLSGIDWMPIGTLTAPFCGTFEGQGHWISNLAVDIDGAETGDVAGLFGYVGATGTVRQLGIASGSVHVSQKSDPDRNCYVGGIVGLNEGRIEQCCNKATVVGNWTMANLGGIAGASGIVGGGASTAIIQDCYNQGRIFTTATNASDANYAGGIVGNTDATVLSVYNYADVSAAIHSGQIYGDISSHGSASNAYANGDAMRGSALDGLLNTAGDYSVWTFRDGELPVLAWQSVSSLTLYNDADNTATLAACDGQTVDVTIQGRTLWKDDSWNTLTLPFALASFGDTPLEGATVMRLTDVAFADHTLTLNFTEVANIAAGVPYIVKWASGTDIVNPVFTRVTISKTPAPTDFPALLTFAGNYAPVTLTEGDRQKLYLSTDNTLYYPAADIPVGSFRAYFVLDDSLYAADAAAGGSVRNFVLNFFDEDETTSIHNGEWRVAGSEWYTLDGRKLAHKPGVPGVYIRDGKRMFIK